MNIILFGPPGAGKETQADKIVKNFNLYKVSTGHLLREEIRNNSELGEKIRPILDKGLLVSDEIINNLIEKILSNKKINNNLIFDGYPRTINQAKNLESLLNKSNQKIDYIFFLNVNKDSIIKRIERRKVLEKRSDDDANTILKRYDIYMRETKPILDFYSSKKEFHEIDGSLKIDQITSKINDIINV